MIKILYTFVFLIGFLVSPCNLFAQISYKGFVIGMGKFNSNSFTATNRTFQANALGTINHSITQFKFGYRWVNTKGFSFCIEQNLTFQNNSSTNFN